MFEILIKSGTDLATSREVVDVAGKPVWRINGGALRVSFALRLTPRSPRTL